MNIFSKLALGFMIAGGLFTSCGEAPKSTDTEAQDSMAIDEVTAEKELSIDTDTANSIVNWIGSKPTGDRHTGTFAFQSGTLKLEGDQIKGGVFEIDLNSMVVTDIPADNEKNGKLRGHLLSGDFFQADSFPIVKFEIASVEPYSAPTETAEATQEGGEDLSIKDPTHTVSGNLTLRGVTKSISFPVKAVAEGEGMKFEANFNIDRTEWGVNYMSDESIADKFINKKVNIGFTILAK